MAKIKFCGIMTTEDVEFVNELHPDYVGFIFWQKSSRNLTLQKACELRRLIDAGIKTVGVFVDADIDFVKTLYIENVIDIAQLHGNEDEEYIKKLQDFNIEVIKAFKVTNEEEVNNAVLSSADYIMFDPGKGEGNTFNWELIKDVRRDYFLAGGLNPSNVGEAVEMLSPYAVDVSSGIETEGKKDGDKMAAFADVVRGAVLV